MLPCHGARSIALREILEKPSQRDTFVENVARVLCAARATARVLMACPLQPIIVMDTRTRTQKASWLRRTSWKLGSFLGAIAKRLGGPSIPISALILARSSPAAVTPEQPIEDVAQLFVAGKVTKMPVIDHGVAIGVVTRTAVGETLEHDGPHTPVGLVALSDVVVVAPNDSLDVVRDQLDDHPGAVILVLDRGVLVGLVTREELETYIEERAAPDERVRRAQRRAA